MTTTNGMEAGAGLAGARPYPLVFRPVILEKVWGGRRLARLGKVLPEEGKKYGESWEVADMASTSASGAGGGAVRTEIANGPLAGKTLGDAAGMWGEDLYVGASGGAGGAGASGGAGFPLLFKYLDASENLSVQVHPSRAFLRERGGAGGAASGGGAAGYHLKTESWYIVDAEPGAKLFIGIKEGVTSAEFERRVREGTVEEVLVAVPAVAGACHTLPSGTMHALGAGVLVAEVQTASDTTFRVYDWGRQGRALHVAESLACGTFADTAAERRTPAPPVPGKLEDGAMCGRLAATEFYTIDEARPGQGDELTIGYKCGKGKVERGGGDAGGRTGAGGGGGRGGGGAGRVLRVDGAGGGGGGALGGWGVRAGAGGARDDGDDSGGGFGGCDAGGVGGRGRVEGVAGGGGADGQIAKGQMANEDGAAAGDGSCVSDARRASAVKGGRTAWKRIAVVVLLGVVTTFVVSAYCSYRGRMWMSKVESVDRRATWWFTADEEGDGWAGSGVDDVTVTRNAITGMVMVSTAYAGAYTGGPERWGMRSPGAAVGDVSRDRIAYVCEPWAVDLIAPEHVERGPVSEARPAPGMALVVRHRMAAGWPMPAFEMTSEARNGPISPMGSPSVRTVWRGGVVVRADQIPLYGGPPWEFWAIPLWPRWGGLVVNTGLAGVGWWVVLMLPGVVRRWRRRRAGRCVACGYSMEGLTGGCPECGAGRESGRARRVVAESGASTIAAG